MALYLCRHCDVRNDEPGTCVMCLRSLGSPAAAVRAAAASATLLGALWVAASALTGHQLTVLALFYGAVVSGVTTQISGGRGPLYQLIASGYTVAGILAADSAVIWLHWDALVRRGPVPERPEFYELIAYQAQYDGVSAAFCALGVLGGFFIWAEGSAAAR